MAQVQYTNIGGAESLWVAHSVRRFESANNTTCNAATSGSTAVRWYQLNVTGGTIAANNVQGRTWDPDATNTFYRFMPSLAVDRMGDMAVGYSKSNATTNPQIKYAGRLAGDPRQHIQPGRTDADRRYRRPIGQLRLGGVHPLGRLQRDGTRSRRLPVLGDERVLHHDRV